MVSQKYVVAAVNLVKRRVISGKTPVPVEVQTAEVRASPTPLPTLETSAGWSANTPTLDIQFTVWGPSVSMYVPGFIFDLSIP